MTIDPTLVLVWTLVVVIASLILLLVWRDLFADRSRGRRRCPRCWHDLQVTPGLRCPECGKEVREEAQLFATRRHWRAAIVHLLALFVGAMVVRVQMTGENLFDYAPTWLLTRSLPYSSAVAGQRDAIRDALESRVAHGDLSDGQVIDLARRITIGDRDALPASDAWRNRYGGLLTVLANRGLDALDRGDTSDPFLTALDLFRAIPARPSLSAAADWPTGEPLIVELRIDEWWPPTTYARVRVRDLDDGTERLIGLDSGGNVAPAYPLSFAAIAEGATQRKFRVTIESRKTLRDGTRDEKEPWSEAASTDITVPVKSAPPLALTGVSTPAMDEAIHGVFREGLMAWRTGWRRYGLRFDASRTAEPDFAGVLIGLDIEVREGDRVRRHSRIWWPAGSGPAQARWEILSEDRSPLSTLTGAIESSTGTWTVHIRGDREVAIKALAALRAPTGNGSPFTRYWSGEITFPIDVRIEESSAPRRRWFALPPEDLEPASPTGPTPST